MPQDHPGLHCRPFPLCLGDQPGGDEPRPSLSPIYEDAKLDEMEKANQDAMVVNQAIRERDEARREAEAHQVDLGVEVAQRLDAEEVSTGLRADLAEARGLLQVESDEYDLLSSTVLVVYGDLQVA